MAGGPPPLHKLECVFRSISWSESTALNKVLAIQRRMTLKEGLPKIATSEQVGPRVCEIL